MPIDIEADSEENEHPTLAIVYFVIEVMSGDGRGEKVYVPVSASDVIILGVEKKLFQPWHEGEDLRVSNIDITFRLREEVS